MRHWFKLTMGAVLAASLIVLPVRADNQPVKNKGLYISPLRQYLESAEGKTQRGAFTIGNYTDNKLTVEFFAEQFSVADYTYDLKFESPPKEDWIKFDTTQVTLAPYKSQVITYGIQIPRQATPGGHYFTLLAKTTIQNGSVTSNIQVASVLYVTVRGKIEFSSIIQKHSAPWIVFNERVPYQLDVKNTGNAHFFVYVSGQLQGLSAKPRESADARILLPGAIRTISGSISAPSLPGVYKIIYGYKTDGGQTVERSSYLLYLPPWSVLIPIGLCVVFWPLLRHGKKRPTGS